MQQSIHQLKVTIDFSSLAEPLPFGGSTVLSLNSYTTSASPIGCHYANEVCFFFRRTPYGSRQIVYQSGKPVAFCKFTELMQWQHDQDDNVH